MEVQVTGGGVEGRIVKVTPNGELVIAPLEYSGSTFQNMNVVDTAFNFHLPTSGKRLVVTGLVISTDRNVGVNGAVIEFYEADSATSTTVDKTALRVDMAKNDILDIMGMNSIVAEGKFLNGKTDDANVLATIFGYEVNV